MHYYFGGKAKLLDALVEERIAPVMREAVAPLLAGGEALPLAAIVPQYIRTLAANPWLPPLLAREVLSEGGALRQRFLTRVAGPIAGQVPARIARAQREGRVRDDLDPRLVTLSILSALVFPMIAAPVWRVALDVPIDASFPDRLAAHTLAVLRHGLEVTP